MVSGDDAGGTGTPKVAPTRFDTQHENTWRVFDALLGGKDNFQVDREARDLLVTAAPAASRIARDSREFLVRTSRFLAAQAGITQFIDCGAVMPTADNTRTGAQQANPDARVVYMARDSTVLAHGRATFENDQTRFALADFREPRQVFQNPTISRFLDLEQPIGLLHMGTMQFVAEGASEVIKTYRDLLPSGSYLVLGDMVRSEDPTLAVLATRLAEVFRHIPKINAWLRSRDEILSFFDGLELVEPGLVTLAEWWPDGPSAEALDPSRHLAVGAVARKP